jgi:hypothetical protein
MSQPSDSNRRRMWCGLLLARAGSEFALSGAVHATLMLAGLFILVGGGASSVPGTSLKTTSPATSSVGFEGVVEGGGENGVLDWPAEASFQVSVYHADSAPRDPGVGVSDAELVLSEDDRGLPGGSSLMQGIKGRRGSGKGGDGEGDGEGNGRGGRPGGDMFFGIAAGGRKIVYVIDCSGSMLAPHFSEDKTRFQRLKREMHRSIDALPRDREFFVIFFSDSSLPMPAKSLQPASKEHKKIPGMGRQCRGRRQHRTGRRPPLRAAAQA